MAINVITYNDLSLYPSELDLTDVWGNTTSKTSTINQYMNKDTSVAFGNPPRVFVFRTIGKQVDRTKSYIYWVDSTNPSITGRLNPSSNQAGLAIDEINIEYPLSLDGKTIKTYLMLYPVIVIPKSNATYTGSNATVTTDEGVLPVSIPTGATRTFTITPNEGYELNEVGTYNGIPITNIVDGVASFTTTVTEDINIVWYTTLKPTPPSSFSVTFKGTNCTASVRIDDGSGSWWSEDLPYNETVTIDIVPYYENIFTITANAGFEFTQQGLYGDVPITNISADKTVATITGEVAGSADLVIHATPIATEVDTVTVRFNSSNGVVSSTTDDGSGGVNSYNYPKGVDVSVPLGDSHEFTLSADLGYEIVEASYNGITITNITPDNTQAYFTTIVNEDIVIEMVTMKTTTDVTGFNRIYQLTTNELSDFASQRFTTTQGVDLGQFIINVLKLPFQVPPTYSGERETIKLGNYNVSTVAEKLKSDELEVEAGTITVPSVYGNSYDYLDTEATLHLPYGNSIKLDVNYVIDCDITIRYYLDVYTGATTINVTSSKVDDVIQSSSVTIGTSIPFITYLNETQNKLEKNYINNKLTQAYIEIARNKQQDNPYNDVIDTHGVLTDELGYIKVEDIQLVTTASTQEIDMIRTQLREGVIING